MLSWGGGLEQGCVLSIAAWLLDRSIGSRGVDFWAQGDNCLGFSAEDVRECGSNR